MAGKSATYVSLDQVLDNHRRSPTVKCHKPKSPCLLRVKLKMRREEFRKQIEHMFALTLSATFPELLASFHSFRTKRSDQLSDMLRYA